MIKVPSETRYIRKVSSKILAGLAPYDLGEGKIFDIRLCVEEAVRNAMVHGNRSDRHLTVKIECCVNGGDLIIEVEDQGAGFDHRFLADPTTSGHIMKNSGRGVYLIKKLMDEVRFNEIGNRITMVKRLK